MAPPAPPLRPSNALDAADAPAVDDETAAPDAFARAPSRARGELLHALLQRLPDVAARAPRRRRRGSFLAARGAAFVAARANEPP
jgi:hypothetical protein